MLLAAQSEAAVADYLKRLKPTRLTSHTRIEKKDLAAIIDEARETGFAQTVDQAADGVTGTASVIRDASGDAIGALIVAAPSGRLEDRLDELAELVREEAATISRSLGYRTQT